MPVKTFKAFLLPFLMGCNNHPAIPFPSSPVKQTDTSTAYYSIISAIPLPEGYKRMTTDNNSFTSWLRNVPLKRSNTVYLYDGREKPNQSAQFAVLDISVGDKDLQQCADAVMRLRAEYQYAQGEFGSISFTDNEGTVYQFRSPYNRTNFDAYLQRVFGMCGSASLAKQLKASSITAIKPGDVIIRGGFPGHAVMVMDVAVNDAGQKIFLLAQSYMPAQDIHVLNNPMNEKLSPWYAADTTPYIRTPEYVFTTSEVKQW